MGKTFWVFYKCAVFSGQVRMGVCGLHFPIRVGSRLTNIILSLLQGHDFYPLRKSEGLSETDGISKADKDQLPTLFSASLGRFASLVLDRGTQLRHTQRVRPRRDRRITWLFPTSFNFLGCQELFTDRLQRQLYRLIKHLEDNQNFQVRG